MIINSNSEAQITGRMLGEASQQLSKSMARLSSGSKNVSAADDVAGQAVATRFDAQINRNQAAVNNLMNAASLVHTQDGFLEKIGKALDRMSELAVLALDVTKTDNDRVSYNSEFQALAASVTDLTAKDFNGVSLFSARDLKVVEDTGGVLLGGIQGNYLRMPPGPPASCAALADLTSNFAAFGAGTDITAIDAPNTVNAGIDFNPASTLQDFVDFFNQTGSSGISASYDESTGLLSVSLASNTTIVDATAGMKAMGFVPTSPVGPPPHVYDGGSLGKNFTAVMPPAGVSAVSVNLLTANDAAAALRKLKSAINQLTADRATLGANLAGLHNAIDQVGMLNDNLSSATSAMKDTDVSEEVTTLSKYSILVQAGTAMLAQANTNPSRVLRLLE